MRYVCGTKCQLSHALLLTARSGTCRLCVAAGGSSIQPAVLASAVLLMLMSHHTCCACGQRLRTLNQFCPLKDLSTYALSTARQASRNSSCSEVTAWLGRQPGPSASTAAAAAAANRAPICYTNITSSVLALLLCKVIADRCQALVLRTQAHACVDVTMHTQLCTCWAA